MNGWVVEDSYGIHKIVTKMYHQLCVSSVYFEYQHDGKSLKYVELNLTSVRKDCGKEVVVFYWVCINKHAHFLYLYSANWWLGKRLFQEVKVYTLFWVKASNTSQHYGMIFLCLKIENSILELLSNVQRSTRKTVKKVTIQVIFFEKYGNLLLFLYIF